MSCDNVDCQGQELCQLLVGGYVYDAAWAASGAELAFPCLFVEVMDLVPTPSVEWFVAEEQRRAQREDSSGFALPDAPSS